LPGGIRAASHTHTTTHTHATAHARAHALLRRLRRLLWLRLLRQRHGARKQQNQS
jgi:hypothetical protein